MLTLRVLSGQETAIKGRAFHLSALLALSLDRSIRIFKGHTHVCIPMAAAFAIQAMTAVMQHQSEKKAYEANSKAVRENQEAQQAAITRQMDQTNQQAADKMSERAIRAKQEFALINTISGESGGGLTSRRLAFESIGARNQDLASIDSNRKNQLSELGFDSTGVNRQAESQLRSLNKPSVGKTALQIGSAGVQAFSAMQSVKPKPPGN